MADKMNSFEEFRTAISNLLDAYDRVVEMKDFISSLWVQADFDDVLASNAEGIDSGVLFDIINNRVTTVQTAVDSVRGTLNQMKK